MILFCINLDKLRMVWLSNMLESHSFQDWESTLELNWGDQATPLVCKFSYQFFLACSFIHHGTS